MTQLSKVQVELVALGAAMGSNCVPCIQYHIPEARKAGLTDLQIAEAIRKADKVRQVPARKVLDAAMQMLQGVPSGERSGAECAPAGAASVSGVLREPVETVDTACCE